MRPNEASGRCQLTRRSFLGAATAVLSIAGSAIAQQPAPTQPAPRVKGPRVWLDMDQAELDAAYDQSVYAPNLEQIVKRYATNSEGVRARLGSPHRYAYGGSAIEGLDIYATKGLNAPINIFIHGGAWRTGLAKNYAFAAELFVQVGAHLVVPDHVWVQDAGGNLMPLAEQVRHVVTWVHRNAQSFGGDPNRIYVSGHSSGAHLAAVLLTTDWPKDFNLPADIIKAGCAAVVRSTSSRYASRRVAGTSSSRTRWNTR